MFQRLAAGIGFSLATALTLSTTAQAASFTTNVSQNTNPEADIWLRSITQNGVTFNNFNLVNRADILSNTPITRGLNPATTTSNPEDRTKRNDNSGAASTDRGDLATAPLPVSGINNPTGTEIAAFLGNTNLNNIIDTEDNGSFGINLFFNRALRADTTGLDNLFFWERGMNSDLGIQAIDAAGNLIGNFLKLTRNTQTAAGYRIDTMEIDNIQQVGSWGVRLAQLGVTSAAGIRVTANGSYRGPDFKVIARDTASVPEPATMAGLGLIAGALAVSRRRQVKQGS